jgi:hypothetical protein
LAGEAFGIVPWRISDYALEQRRRTRRCMERRGRRL